MIDQPVAAGKVFIVGAGPGHPSLITLRGAACLENADAVIYDYLVNAELLCHASSRAEIVCLARHRGRDVRSQQSINEELVRRAREGQRVVRLKGGDPMIFGRAGEELAALASARIPFEIVPGVTAASAAAAFAGVTITDRRYASAVALIAGHEKLETSVSKIDHRSLADFPGTLVVYMGVSSVRLWSQSLLAAGKAAETPVLAVRRCSWPDQSMLECTLGALAGKLSDRQRLPPPVVIIIGPAARRVKAYDWYSRLPMRGQSVVITRAEHQAAPMANQLRELGAQVLLQPAITIDDPADWHDVDDKIARLAEFDFLVFSSANGVERFLNRTLSLGLDMRHLASVRLATIGPSTMASLTKYGLQADVRPDNYRAEALAQALSGQVRGRRVLWARASRGRQVLADGLRAAGAQVDEVVVYRSSDVLRLSDEVAEHLDCGAIDWVTVTSSAIACSVCRLFGERLHGVKIASISPITTATLRDQGFEPTLEAVKHTADGLVSAIRDWTGRSTNSAGT